jgi:hypothetical protein
VSRGENLRRKGKALLWTSGLPTARGEKKSEDKILMIQSFKKPKMLQQHCNKTYITTRSQKFNLIIHAQAFSIRGKRDGEEG